MNTYDSDNIFAKILSGEMSAVKLFENDVCLAVMDVFPQSPGHALVIPKAASRNLLDADPQSLQQSIVHVQRLARASKAALGADGIRIAQFNEEPAGQTVFHLHWHVIPVYNGHTQAEHGTQLADPKDLTTHANKIIAHLSE